MILKKLYAIVLLAAACLAAAPTAQAASPLDALKGAIGALVGGSGTSSVIAQGTWTYAGPAVSFKSDNALQNLGGAAAGTALESKIKPYYDKIGLQGMTFTVGADSTYVMKVKKLTFKGKIVYGEKGECTLQMQGLGKIAGGSFKAQWQVVGNSLSLTFDVSRLVDLVGKIAAVSGKSSLTTLAKLLESYDGVYAGFRFNKTSDSAAATSSTR